MSNIFLCQQRYIYLSCSFLITLLRELSGIMLSNRIKRRIDDFTVEGLQATFEYIQGVAAVIWQALIDEHPGADIQDLRSRRVIW